MPTLTFITNDMASGDGRRKRAVGVMSTYVVGRRFDLG